MATRRIGVVPDVAPCEWRVFCPAADRGDLKTELVPELNSNFDRMFHDGSDTSAGDAGRFALDTAADEIASSVTDFVGSSLESSGRGTEHAAW